MRRQLLVAIRMVLLLTVLAGVAYPLAVTAVAQGLFPAQADGSLVERDGAAVGSSLVGQAFRSPTYFHTRPSAAGALAAGAPLDGADPNDLALRVSGPSNQGPTNPDLLAAIAARAVAYREANGLDPDDAVPVDAVTASASGVDPHISVANALLQAPRVAAERAIDLEVVLDLVERHTDDRPLGILGEQGVRVLPLNLALDRLDA
jgi:K+-transporting ATPase ATPase C chain